MNKCITAFSFCLLSCTTGIGINTIYVDSGFSSEEKQEIQLGADSWEKATELVHINFVWDYQGDQNDKVVMLPFDPKTGYFGNTVIRSEFEKIYINLPLLYTWQEYVDTDAPTTFLVRYTVAHELGHHITRNGAHLPPDIGIMSSPHSGKCLTKEDINYFCTSTNWCKGDEDTLKPFCF